MKLDIEKISAAVHDKWMETKRANGVTSRKSESDEELMVPYEQLSEKAKDLDRGSVKAVLDVLPPMHCANPRCQSFGCAKHDEAQTEPDASSRLAEVTAQLAESNNYAICIWCGNKQKKLDPWTAEEAKAMIVDHILVCPDHPVNQVANLTAENATLRAELEQVKEEREKALVAGEKILDSARLVARDLTQAEATVARLTGERDGALKDLKDADDLCESQARENAAQAAALTQAQQALRDIGRACETYQHSLPSPYMNLVYDTIKAAQSKPEAALPSDAPRVQAQENK